MDAIELPGPVAQFFRALDDRDIDALRGCLAAEFEMVVPQRPARGFVGREQELANLALLFETYADFAVTVLRAAVTEDEVWTETVGTATGTQVAAVIIWTMDPDRQLIVRGRFYSEPVQQDAADIEEFMRGLTAGPGEQNRRH